MIKTFYIQLIIFCQKIIINIIRKNLDFIGYFDTLKKTKGNNMTSPIIFIHYGYSEYLEYTLKASKIFNPLKRVILLGNDANKTVALKNGVEHFYFDQYGNGNEIETFNKVFKFIAGKNEKNEYWINFVFKRWFMVYNFLVKENIDSFWTFDSDNLILTSLEKYEDYYKKFDCTEQCNGMCINGFISKRDVVKGYVDKINELFQRDEYLDKQKKEMDEHPYWSFTEMRAYETYRDENKLNTVKLSEVINDEIFDDYICQKHDMEQYDTKLYNNNILKKVYLASDGEIFYKNEIINKFIKVNLINMSWTPHYLFEKILSHSIKKLKREKISLY